MRMDWTSYFKDQLPEIIEEIRMYVEMESPTHQKNAVDKVIHYTKEKFTSLGCAPVVIPQSEFGDQLRLEYGDKPEQILILGHLDTVKPIGTIQKEPWRQEAGKIFGPGIYDMKAGIVFAYFALKAITEHQLPLRKKLVFFWNSDEEAGSFSSQTWIEQAAHQSELALVLEPAFGMGDIKISRKGGGQFILQVFGRAAHAGHDHAIGINAIEEIAHQIGVIQAWTDYERGTTLSVGTIKGGTVSNVIPDFAEIVIDVRVSSMQEAKRITDLISQLTPKLAGARLQVTGGIDKFPMEQTKDTELLFEHARRQATLENFLLEKKSVSGTSDGNIAALAGIPVLDGLGPIGDGLHAPHEHILVDYIPRQIALLVRLLTTF